MTNRHLRWDQLNGTSSEVLVVAFGSPMKVTWDIVTTKPAHASRLQGVGL